jgi:hypothetical protein
MPSRACSASRGADGTAGTTTCSSGCCLPRCSPRSPARGTAPAQAPVPRTARTVCSVRRRGGHLRRSRACEAGRRWPGIRAARSAVTARRTRRPRSVDVEGVSGKRLVLSDEVAQLEAPPEPPPSVAFVPPFDPTVWDRKLLAACSGSTTSGSSSSHRQAPLGLVRAADPLPGPLRRPDRAADRAGRRSG